MLLNCGVGEDSWESLTARRSNQSILKEISPEYSLEGLMLKLKLQYFGLSCEELTHWKRPWCWERLKAGGEGDDRGWDGWMASPTQRTWVWVSSGRWWRTGKPDMLQSMGSERIRHSWGTDLNWRPSADWMEWLWRVIFFTPSPPDFNVNLTLKTLHGIYPEYCLTKFLGLVAQTSWHKINHFNYPTSVK